MVDNPTSGPSPSLRQRCLAIELLVVDVDGVLTDGGIIHADNNAELKNFHAARWNGTQDLAVGGKAGGPSHGSQFPGRGRAGGGGRYRSGDPGSHGKTARLSATAPDGRMAARTGLFYRRRPAGLALAAQLRPGRGRGRRLCGNGGRCSLCDHCCWRPGRRARDDRIGAALPGTLAEDAGRLARDEVVTQGPGRESRCGPPNASCCWRRALSFSSGPTWPTATCWAASATSRCPRITGLARRRSHLPIPRRRSPPWIRGSWRPSGPAVPNCIGRFAWGPVSGGCTWPRIPSPLKTTARSVCNRSAWPFSSSKISRVRANRRRQQVQKRPCQEQTGRGKHARNQHPAPQRGLPHFQSPDPIQDGHQGPQ